MASSSSIHFSYSTPFFSFKLIDDLVDQSVKRFGLKADDIKVVPEFWQGLKLGTISIRETG